MNHVLIYFYVTSIIKLGSGNNLCKQPFDKNFVIKCKSK